MKYFAPTKISENIRETPEGYLLCVGVPIARTGEYEYGPGETPIEVASGGVVLISRSDKEVFRPQTIASFEGKPLTIRHPAQFVAPGNWKDLAKGHIQNVRRGEGEDKDNLIADILITDSVAISLVKSGMRGLSCGYEAEYTQTGKGRGKQTDIIGNHLALVEEGRAGSTYAINDEKGDPDMSKKTFRAFLQSYFGKSQVADQVMKAFDEEKVEEKKDDKKKEESKDDDKAKDASSYDELVKLHDDLGKKISAMKPEAKDDDDKENTEKVSEGENAKDDEESPAESGMESRMKALEEAVAKLVEGEQGEEEAAVDEDEEGMVGDDDDEEGEESEDEEVSMATDEKSRVEILAPGMKPGKDFKSQALKACYATADGKKAINAITGGKAPAFNKSEVVDMLFLATSELLKSSRKSQLSKTKHATIDYVPTIFNGEGHMTPEKMNELNAAVYKRA